MTGCFQERSEPRAVTHVLRLRGGHEVWCPVTGLDAKGHPVPAMARKVEYSGEGMCYLVYGNLWGPSNKRSCLFRSVGLSDGYSSMGRALPSPARQWS